METWALAWWLVVVVIVPVMLARCDGRVQMEVAHEGGYVFVAGYSEVCVLTRAGVMTAGSNVVVVSRSMNGSRRTRPWCGTC